MILAKCERINHTAEMISKIRWFEISYALLNSGVKASVWIIPLLVTLGVFSFNEPSDYYQWLPVVFFIFAAVALLNIWLSHKTEELRNSLDESVFLLREDRNRHVSEIRERAGRVHPDEGRVQLGEYGKAINSLRTKGFIEFECRINYMPNKSELVYIYSVAPGMHKYFMVAIQVGRGECCVIETPADVTRTWFDNIFQMLGHTSSYVSERQQVPSGYEEYDGTCYIISRFKCFKRGKTGFLRIYI